MPDTDKNEAKYIGNKVKVKVSKNRSGPRPGRTAGKTAKKTQPADPVSPEMLQPVDYMPPDEEKLNSIREEGFREGQKLLKNEAAVPKKESAAETGAAKAGAEKTGAAKAGAEKPGAAKAGAEKTGAAKTGAANAGEYIGRKDRAAPGKNDVQPQNKTDNASMKREKEGKDNEGTDNAPEMVSPAQIQNTGRSQRKGRKKKKAEQKAEKRAAERAGTAAGVQTGGNEIGKTAQKGADSPELPGKDKLKGGGGGKTGPWLTVPRTVVMVLSGLFMLYALSPLAVGVVTVGILPPLCIGAFFFTVAYFWPKICECKKPWFNALFTLCGIIVIAGITLIFYLFGLMYAASAVKPPANRSDYTVVVLGCKTIGNRPSLMLGDRLDAAAEFLRAHPGSYCIVSGGQGEDELAPESEIMKRYLVSRGISELRIVEERNSATTFENIENSCAMLDEYNLYDDIVIVTDRFHQYRARHYVEKQGLRCYAVNSETRWYLAIHYWFKEMVAVGLIQLGYEIN